jgi:signal peptidase I
MATMMDLTEVAVKPRRPWIAAVLTLFVPGLGQVYGGEPKRGLAVYLGYLVCFTLFLLSGAPKVFFALIAFLVVFMLFLIWAIWDAIGVAHRNRDYVLKPFNRWYTYIAIVVAVNVLIAPRLIALSPVRSFRIISESMEPALLVGDHVYADDTYYRSAKPARGHLVVFTTSDDPYQRVARVIGLEEEQIEIRDKAVYLDRRRIRDSWGHHSDPNSYSRADPLMGQRDNLALMRIPVGTVFVLADNRDNSNDSRFFGPVPLSALEGRLIYVYWAADKSRIGKSLR